MKPPGLRCAGVALATLAILGSVGSGCGYKLAGANTFLPEHIKVMVVVPFENRTEQPEIEQRVTEEVALVLSKRGGYKVLIDKGNADAQLEGAVTSYRTIPVEFGPEGRATRVEAVVTVQATLRELGTDEVLWSQSGLTFREQFGVLVGQDFFAEQSEALDSIARGAADALVTAIIEGF